MLSYKVDFDEVNNLIGTVYGLADASEDNRYIDGLIENAHAHAANVFDETAAATATAGKFKHMYEYGTSGVTPGRGGLNPVDAAARLWTHKISGRGSTQNIYFVFRPAVIRNPQPTVASTGVKSKYLRKLSQRKYVFRNKAMVMEFGTQVEIKAENGNFLFVPFYGEPPRGATNSQSKRGFMMYPFHLKGAISAVPGQKTQGTFTAFWNAWWETAGEELMSKDIGLTFEKDVAVSIEAAGATHGTLGVPSTGSAKVAKARKATSGSLISNSTRRRPRD